MGKSLVIKGADFSANGFQYGVVTKEITTLVDIAGNVVNTAIDLSLASTVYWYERVSDHAVTFGINFPGCVATSKKEDLGSVQLVDLEDYTHAKVTTRVAIDPQGIVAGAAVLFLLDANRNPVGGFSTGNSSVFQNVGSTVNLRTFEMDIPANAKYALCTFQAGKDSNDNTIDVSDFKLTLEKYVIVED